jgi:hypothetical protein
MKLNPKIFTQQTMKPKVRRHLLDSAEEFIDSLGVPLDVLDIALTGSNAGYNYMPGSDLDVHIIIDDSKLPLKSIWRELFDAKKAIWLSQRNVSIKKIPLEMYVEMKSEPHQSDAIYSILNNKWIQKPKQKVEYKSDPKIEQKLKNFAQGLLNQTNSELIKVGLKMIFQMRQIALTKFGMNNAYNTAFRRVRNTGLFDEIRQHQRSLRDKALTIENQNREIANEEATHPSRSSNQRSNILAGGTPTFGSPNRQIGNSKPKKTA